MKRLTNSNPENDLQTLLNYAYAKDGKVKLSYADGEYGADLCEYISAKSKEAHCGLAPSPKAVAEGACMECDCELGLLYLIAIQAAELRARLMMIEDILGDEYDLEEIQKKVKGVEIDQFSGWIPVTERLPPMHTEIYEDFDDKIEYQISNPMLIVTEDGKAEVARCGLDDDGKPHWFNDDGAEYDVLRWQNVPEVTGNA